MAATVPKLWRSPAPMGNVGGPFHLVTSGGQPVTEHSWPGHFLLVYFGYTHCPAACPTALANMQAALDRLGGDGNRIQALFITVDPRRDTPAWIGRYSAMFGPRILGLTGTRAETSDAAERYGISWNPVRTGPGADDYEIEHSSVIYLMRPDGTLDASFRADEDPGHLARDIATSLRS